MASAFAETLGLNEDLTTRKITASKKTTPITMKGTNHLECESKKIVSGLSVWQEPAAHIKLAHS